MYAKFHQDLDSMLTKYLRQFQEKKIVERKVCSDTLNVWYKLTDKGVLLKNKLSGVEEI